MERAKEVVSEKIRYRKIGGGSARLNIGGQNRIIKPNEVFTALPSEIPFAFKDTIIPLDSLPKVEAAKPQPVKVSFSVKPRGKSKSLFDVVDNLGKVINDKPLPKETAEQLVEDLGK
jgi:hypothetical protein